MPVHLHRDHDDIPHITTGTAAPSTAPAKIGDIYIDTNNKLVYVGIGTTDSGDWEVMNGS